MGRRLVGLAIASCLGSRSDAARVVSGRGAAGAEAVVDGEAVGSPITMPWHWLADGNILISADAAEQALRQETPVLQADEKVEMAFKVGRDKTYLTNKRIILRWKSMFSRRKVEFKSVPYRAIKAFSIRTAGRWPDMDTHLRIWTSMPDVALIEKGFAKGQGTARANIFEIGKLFARQTLGIEIEHPQHFEDGSLLQARAEANQTWQPGDLGALLWGSPRPMSAEEADMELRVTVPILGVKERVLVAFKGGGDFILLTTGRILIIDVFGVTGRKVEYQTVPYECIRAFSVETEGGVLLGDAVLVLWTDLPGMGRLEYSLTRGQADIMTLQWVLAKHVTRSLAVTGPAPVTEPEPEPMPLSPASLAQAAAAVHGNRTDAGDSPIWAWLTQGTVEVDAKEAEAFLRKEGDVLLMNEKVDLAYRATRFQPYYLGGYAPIHADTLLLTNRRVLYVHLQRVDLFGGAKVEYITVPYGAMQGFGVRSAGGWSLQAEMHFWTGIQPPPAPPTPPPPVRPQGEPQQPDPQTLPWNPGMSFLSFHLHSARADVRQIQYHLSHHVFREDTGPAIFVPAPVVNDSDAGDLAAWLGGEAQQVDSRDAESRFRTEGFLGAKETVDLAIKVGRDYTLFTSRRVLTRKTLDVGGSVVEYNSIPWSSLQGSSVASAGVMEFDATIELLTTMPWMATLVQDLRGSRVDLGALLHVLSRRMLGPDVPKGSFLQGSDEWGTRVTSASASPNAAAVDAVGFEQDLRRKMPLLQDSERVLMAFQVGRDTIALTTKRILKVDVQGVSGMRVNYRSLPYSSCQAFAVLTAGMFDSETVMTVWTGLARLPFLQQTFQWDKADIYKVQESLARSILP